MKNFKSCPFCNSMPILTEAIHWPESFHIGCYAFDCIRRPYVTGKTLHEAVEKWFVFCEEFSNAQI